MTHKNKPVEAWPSDGCAERRSSRQKQHEQTSGGRGRTMGLDEHSRIHAHKDEWQKRSACRQGSQPASPNMGSLVTAGLNALDCMDLVADHRACLVDARIHHNHLVSCLIDLCGFLHELCQDLVGQKLDFENSSRLLRRMERDRIRMNLPAWFWRPERDVEIKVLIFRRVRFMLDELNAPADDIFDAMRELVDDVLRPEEPVSDNQIVGVIEFAVKRGRARATDQ